jgi:hypothetical protein
MPNESLLTQEEPLFVFLPAELFKSEGESVCDRISVRRLRLKNSGEKRIKFEKVFKMIL